MATTNKRDSGHMSSTFNVITIAEAINILGVTNNQSEPGT